MATRRNLSLSMAWALFAATNFFGAALSQIAGHSNIDVRGRVTVQIPNGWTIHDGQFRQQVTDFSKEMIGAKTGHTASLIVSSFPKPSRVWVRVSLLPLTPPLTQAALRKESSNDPKGALADVARAWERESGSMRAALAKHGMKQVGTTSFALEPLGGQTAIAIRYARTNYDNSSETIKVSQYHVPLGNEKALITLSYVDGDPSAIAAHDRIKQTLAIR